MPKSSYKIKLANKKLKMVEARVHVITGESQKLNISTEASMKLADTIICFQRREFMVLSIFHHLRPSICINYMIH